METQEKIEKSVVTCDLEGRIETFNKAAVNIFGYDKDEVIGKKRVSLFSPGHIVLGHVEGWLSTATQEGKYEGRTVFVRKDGSTFAADIKITPTFKNGEQIGYCGVTTPREDVPVEDAMPEVGLAVKIFTWLVVTRAPFLSATLIPILVAAAGVVYAGGWGSLSWGLLGLALLGGSALHVAANTFNDYFDHTSGVDEANNDYFLPFSGGSRSIELGLIQPRQLLVIASVSLLVAMAAGVAATVLSTPLVWAFGAVGAFAAYFYTAPPLKLIARKGLGELFVGLCFGPLMVLGARAVLDGGLTDATIIESLWTGGALGLLTTAILWINEFPDLESDKATGKTNLVVVLGKPAARVGYALILLGAFGCVVGGALTGALPMTALLALLAVPMGIYATAIAWKHFEDRSLVRANKMTIYQQSVVGLLLAVGLVFGNAL